MSNELGALLPPAQQLYVFVVHPIPHCNAHSPKLKKNCMCNDRDNRIDLQCSIESECPMWKSLKSAGFRRCVGLINAALQFRWPFTGTSSIELRFAPTSTLSAQEAFDTLYSVLRKYNYSQQKTIGQIYTVRMLQMLTEPNALNVV